jgi:CRISPR-associated helicase Cas3
MVIGAVKGMNESFETVVGGTFLEYSDEVLDGGLQLYKHQAETANVEGDIIVLDAPTGAGKTLAALRRIINKRTPAIFIYPTNSLVRNQVTSISKLLEKDLSQRVNLIGPDANISKAVKNVENTDIDLFHFTGESLEKLSESASLTKGSVIDKLLTGTQRPKRMRILLTNPDTLYLTFIGRYQKSGRISEQIDTFRTIVLDEFHLYSGPLLARILFMVNAIRGSSDNPSVELVFLSATHGDILDLLENTYPNISLIKASPLEKMPEKGRQTRHKTRCKIRTLSGVLSNDEEAETIADDILRFYDYDYTTNLKVKVLGIFSSVSFAVRVAKLLRSRISNRGLDPDTIVYQLHGLIPRQARSSLETMNNAILVGTSAIEVGIDFDVPFLVIEAHDIGAFLQRFGRGGRHRKCEAILCVPRTLADRLNDRAEWTFSNFVGEAHSALTELSSYAGFLCNSNVRNILYAMALAASRKPKSPYDKRDRFDLDTAVDFFYELLEANGMVSIGGSTLKDIADEHDPKRIRSRLRSYSIKTMVKYGFLRGTMNSVLIRYPGNLIGQESSIYGECDLFDLFKMKGIIEKAEAHWRNVPSELKKRYEENDPIFVVEDIGKPSYPLIVLTSDAAVRKRTAVYKEPECHLKFQDKYLSMIGQSILSERNLAFHWRNMTNQADYRIPRLFVENEPGGLVIGDWAYVAEYILQKRLEDDRKL